MLARCRRLVKKCLQYPIDEDDDENTVLRKTFSVVGVTIVSIVSVALLALQSEPTVQIGAVLALILSAIDLYFLYIRRISTEVIFETIVFGFVVVIIFWDYSAAMQMKHRCWTMFVLVIDIMLVVRLRRQATVNCCLVVISWLTLTAVEDAFRFGLYDFTGWTEPPPQDCERPPCKDKLFAVQSYMYYVVVFFLDVYFTRGFADAVWEEKVQMQSSVNTAQLIAKCLVKFDLDTARNLMQETSMPEELSSAFGQIIVNLEAYKPYLPQALFDGLHSSDSGMVDRKARPAPGLDTGVAAIVFTDIQGSTSLWEQAPEAMKTALRVHNRVIREALNDTDGYEVKTIGDAFMAAFDDVLHAVSFSLLVQERLFAAPWPWQLDTVPNCEKDVGHGWSGLRVRIGMHEGPVDLEYNAVTNRFDYFGPTVNVASRVEAVGVCGSVAVTDDVLRQVINVSIPPYNDKPFVAYEGTTKLKGVSESLHITFLAPVRLQVRRAGIVRMVEAKWGLANAQSSPRTCYRSTRSQLDDGTRLSDFDSLSPLPNIHRSHGHGALDRIPCATVGNVFLRIGASASVEDLNDSLARLLGYLDRTDGTVVALLGTALLLGWNTSRTCRDHFDQALHYTSLMQRYHRMDENGRTERRELRSPLAVGLLSDKGVPRDGSAADARLRGDGAPEPPDLHTQHIGICSGPVQWGKVGSRTQRFASVVGAPVNLSGELARAAAGYGTLSLYAAMSDDAFFTKKHLARPVDRWSLRPAVCGAVIVYEVNAALVGTRSAITGAFPISVDTPWEWSEAYCAAFTNGEVSAIEAHLRDNPLASHTLSLVAANLRCKTRVPPCVYV
ncbi:Adenylate cyclase [Diplonema papillatum]|nr:Adenylate cyclase [Diplonema papillatum]